MYKPAESRCCVPDTKITPGVNYTPKIKVHT